MAECPAPRAVAAVCSSQASSQVSSPSNRLKSQKDFMATVTDAQPEVVLSNDEILRYSRHLIMPEVAMDGQRKRKAAKVRCIGAGVLGSPLALYLTAAGFGTLGLLDYDVVDYT